MTKSPAVLALRCVENRIIVPKGLKLSVKVLDLRFSRLNNHHLKPLESKLSTLNPIKITKETK